MTLQDLFSKYKRAPFLFIGSGFTRHYYDTPDWRGLLEMFAPKPLNAYISQIGTDYSKVASQIAEDLTSNFWNNPELEEIRGKIQDKIITKSSYLKLKISEYLKKESLRLGIPERWKEELSVLSEAPIDGIITTNWDDLIEQIFPKFNTYIGQEDLLFNKSYNIGEIYKIHGCFKKPESLVLTREDYDSFEKKYVYLSSKLLTIFVEHPVVFLGYSLSDRNIQPIVQSLVCCLSQENINKLRENIIFVEWQSDANFETQIESSTFVLSNGNGISFPCVKILTHTFLPIYDAMKGFKRQIPANVLRLYKENFYDIVYSESPEQRMCVIEERDLESRNDIEFVCGYGAISRFHSAVGYTGLKAPDIFRDLLEPNHKLDSSAILTKSLSNLQGYVPMYRYLREIGIDSDDAYARNSLGLNRQLKKGSDFQGYYKTQEAANDVINNRSLYQLISELDKWRAVCVIPYMDINVEELEILRTFLVDCLNDFLIKSNNYSSHYRKLGCFYDWKKYGW